LRERKSTRGRCGPLVVLRSSNDFKEHSDKSTSFAPLTRKANFRLSECRARRKAPAQGHPLGDRRTGCAIEACRSEANSDGRDKPTLHFERAGRKPLLLNKTNAKNIAAAYGADTSGWIGKPIILYRSTTEFQGETSLIRVKVPNAPVGKAAANRPQRRTLTSTMRRVLSPQPEMLAGDSTHVPTGGPHGGSQEA
jgi:hypothetical protein